jgi:hypothetical protein
MINIWAMVIFTTNNSLNSSILYEFPSVQKLLQQVSSSNYQMNNKQASQTSSLYPLSFFGSHLDPLKHFLNFLRFNRCSLLSYFGKWIVFLCLSLFLAPHHVLRLGLGRYNNKYVKRTNIYVKESSFNQY